ncbi:MAG: M23 family metallopeptidase, partial [Angustibacter sp.]
DPFISATNFFEVEMTVENRESRAPTLVAHEVQRNADAYHYAPYWEPAGQVVRALAGVREQSGAAPVAGPVASPYSIGPVQPQTALIANSLGPMFKIKSIGGYRDPQDEKDAPNGHPAGLALDFMINDIPDGKKTGDRLAKYLQSKAKEIGVDYIIWKQRIWSADRADEGWRKMADRGSVTENHLDHVHLSLTGTGVAQSPGCDPGGGAAVTASGWAAPADGPMTSDFGPRSAPGGKYSTDHRGIDLAPGCDKPIVAAKQGQVIRAGASSGYGNLIEIDHGGGLTTRYAHMYNDGVLVNAGDSVTAGQRIGAIGSNGNSTGCHLHFEILVRGNQVDPELILTEAGVDLG